jgi:hypothetical protein
VEHVTEKVYFRRSYSGKENVKFAGGADRYYDAQMNSNTSEKISGSNPFLIRGPFIRALEKEKPILLGLHHLFNHEIGNGLLLISRHLGIHNIRIPGIRTTPKIR